MRASVIVIAIALLSTACAGDGAEETVEIDPRTFRGEVEAIWSGLFRDLETSANRALGEAEGKRFSAEQFVEQFPEYADEIPILLTDYPEFEELGIPASLFVLFVEFAEEEALPKIETAIAQMRQLPQPRGDEESLIRVFAAFDSGFDVILIDPVASLFGNTDPLARAFDLADDYGFSLEPDGWPPPTILLSTQNAQEGE